MRPNLLFLGVFLVSLIALGACAAPIATAPTVDVSSTSFQLIEFYSPL